MARYLVIEIEDKDAAEKLMQQINTKTRAGAGLRVAGLFAKPGKTCKCPDARRANFGDKNWQPATILRGGRFGWWVCSRCNRPRKAGHQLVNLLKLSDLLPGVEYDGYEFGITDLCVSGFAKEQINRGES